MQDALKIVMKACRNFLMTDILKLLVKGSWLVLHILNLLVMVVLMQKVWMVLVLFEEMQLINAELMLGKESLKWLVNA